MSNTILPDLKQEALRVVQQARDRGICLRLLGGLAIQLHSPSASHAALARAYPDIDYVTDKAGGRRVEDLLVEMGYTPNRTFNTLNGDRRLLFYDEVHGRQVDVFVASFEMCHRIPIADRLALDPLTLPLAELLLTKLQVVHLNDKDVRDICALLIDHPVGEGDAETVNANRIGKLCGDDWGLYKTISLNLDNIHDFSDAYDLPSGARRALTEGLEHLRQAIESAPKSLKWKVRAAIGEKVRWYDLPEEVQRG